MKNHFRCPNCSKGHNKTYQYGTVRGYSGTMVARETHHPDVTCSCGTVISGHEILGGLHDGPPVTISPFLRILMTSTWGALFSGGITYIFASATTSALVGLGFFVLLWVVYLTGMAKVEPYEWP